MNPIPNHPTIILSDKDRKAIEKSRRKTNNLERIRSANSTWIDEVCNSNECFDAPPERKPSTRFRDDFRPALNLGEYVKVSADTSSGKKESKVLDSSLKRKGSEQRHYSLSILRIAWIIVVVCTIGLPLHFPRRPISKRDFNEQKRRCWLKESNPKGYQSTYRKTSPTKNRHSSTN